MSSTWIEDAKVLSEVHLECSQGSPVSSFTILAPGTVNDSEHEVDNVAEQNDEALTKGLDKDGDLILPRRRNTLPRGRSGNTVVIYHRMATVIPEVGLQVWRGALLLSDFILHKFATSNDFKDVVALEFGAGTGLAGIILARQAKLVYLTDKDAEILDNCARNVFANRESFNDPENTCRVRQLDWTQAQRPLSKCREMNRSPYLWGKVDFMHSNDPTIFLAADVIYSDDLTDAFFQTLRRFLFPGSSKVLYLGLEKRYNFSLDVLDVVANGYEKFMSYLDVNCEGEATERFIGKQLDESKIPQYIQEYQRGNDLELWEIRPPATSSSNSSDDDFQAPHASST